MPRPKRRSAAEALSPVLPPAGLSQAALEVWREETTTRTRSKGRLAILTQCLRAFDEANRFHALLEREELVTVTRRTGVHRISPLVRAEKECRQIFALYSKLLGLQWSSTEDGDRAELEPDPERYLTPRDRFLLSRQEAQEPE